MSEPDCPITRQLLELAERGVSPKRIALETRVSISTVWRYTRPVREAKREKNLVLARRLVHDRSVKIKDIARKCRLPNATVVAISYSEGVGRRRCVVKGK